MLDQADLPGADDLLKLKLAVSPKGETTPIVEDLHDFEDDDDLGSFENAMFEPLPQKKSDCSISDVTKK